MKNVNNEQVRKDLEKYKQIVLKYGFHVSGNYMNAPVVIGNLDTGEIEVDLSHEYPNAQAFGASIYDVDKFEEVVEDHSERYKNFSFYTIAYENHYFLFGDKFHDFFIPSKIRGGFWNLKHPI